MKRGSSFFRRRGTELEEREEVISARGSETFDPLSVIIYTLSFGKGSKVLKTLCFCVA